MLKNNFYILCPPGYFGTYINWIILKSNKSTASTTVNNPINSVTSQAFGGSGTAHGHIKIPTHMMWTRVLAWRALNPQTVNRVFTVDASETVEDQVHNFLHPRSVKIECASVSLSGLHQADRTPVFINLYSDTDLGYRLGVIHQILKWPSSFKAGFLVTEAINQYRKNFDPFNCNTREDRNFFVNHGDWLFRTNTKLSDQLVDRMTNTMNFWASTRHELHPQEVHLEEFISEFNAKISNINITEILSPDFLDILIDRLASSGVDLLDFDFEFCRDFHSQFVAAQTTARWFDDVQVVRETRTVPEFLDSHAVISAMLLKHLGGPEKLPAGWEDMSTAEIVPLIY